MGGAPVINLSTLLYSWFPVLLCILCIVFYLFASTRPLHAIPGVACVVGRRLTWYTWLPVLSLFDERWAKSNHTMLMITVTQEHSCACTLMPCLHVHGLWLHAVCQFPEHSMQPCYVDDKMTNQSLSGHLSHAVVWFLWYNS